MAIHKRRKTSSVPDWQSRTWERLVHSGSLLGYSLIISFFILLEIIAISRFSWSNSSGEDLSPRLEKSTLYAALLFPACCFAAVGVWSVHRVKIAIYKYQGRGTGTICIAFACISAAVMALVAYSDVDLKFYGLDVLLLVFLTSGVFVTMKLVSKKHLLLKSHASTASDRSMEPLPASTSNASRVGQQKRRSPLAAVFAQAPFVSTMAIGFLCSYPTAIIPTFFSNGTGIRFLICLFLHPILLETAEAVGRAGKSEETAERLRNGEVTLSHAEEIVIQKNVTPFVLKGLMAMFRRFMLLNMGSPSATIIAVVIASIEETISRGFLFELDAFIRSRQGKPKLEGDELRLQYMVWMCDANNSAIAELCAIFASSYAQILLQRNWLIIAIGYEYDGDGALKFSTMAVFVQLCVELLLEVLVDMIVMWAEHEHGIPATEYFKRLPNAFVFVSHVAFISCGLVYVLSAFIRHPTVFICPSKDICDCIDRPIYEPYVVLDFCNATAGGATNASVALPPEPDLFGSVDPLPIAVAVLTGILILALVWVSVLCARHRRKVQAVKEAQYGLEKAQSNLKQADQKLKLLKEETTEAGQRAKDAEARALTKEKDNEKLRASLAAAQKLVDLVMNESELDTSVRQVKWDELVFGEPVGEGSFGTVYQSNWLGLPVAVKTVRSTKVTEDTLIHFRSEISVMAPLQHPNLVNMLGACWTDGPDKLCLVLEFCAHGSVHTFLKIPEHTWYQTNHKLAVGIAECFKYLHHEQPKGTPLIHRDLKPDNVLVCDALVAKVADFGESTQFDQSKAKAQNAAAALTMTLVGTPMYCQCSLISAPEIVECKPYNEKVDVYSFAITLLEIAIGDTDFLKQQFAKAGMQAVAEGWRPKPPRALVSATPDLWALINDSWSPRPSSRPSFEYLSRLAKALEPSTAIDLTPDAEDFEQLDTTTKYVPHTASHGLKQLLDEGDGKAKLRNQLLFLQILRKEKREAALEEENLRLKKEAEAQADPLAAKLAARPPKDFSQTEFELALDECGDDVEAYEKLLDLVFTLCEDWALALPIDDAKWDYFLYNIAPLKFWGASADHFARIQAIARASKKGIDAKMDGILRRLASSNSGAWICKELDSIRPDVDVATAAGAWFPKSLLGVTEWTTDTVELDEHDRLVLPVYLRGHAADMFSRFRAALASLAPSSSFFEPDPEATVGSAARNQRARRRRSSIAVEQKLADGHLVFRYVRSKCVKKDKRMVAKVALHQENGIGKWPRTAMIGDALRSSIIAPDAVGLRRAWDAMTKCEAWRVVRMKNKFRLATEELHRAAQSNAAAEEEERTFPNLHVNVLFRENTDAPIVVEIQVHLREVLDLKRDSHKLYQIMRADDIGALNPRQ